MFRPANNGQFRPSGMQEIHGSCKKWGAEGRPNGFPLGQDQINFPMATAVSDIRFEKPHSLSYQLRIETKVPSITFV